MNDYIDKKIIDLEQIFNKNYSAIDEGLKYGLPQWYESIKYKKISELTEGDLARMIRQNIFVEVIVSLCLDKISLNPLIGYMYEGELFDAVVNYIDKLFWERNDSLKEKAIYTLLLIDKRLEDIVSDLELEEEKSEYKQNVKAFKNTLINNSIE